MWDEISLKFQKYVETGEFNGDQLSEIMEGLKEGVEIIVFADPIYSAGQMHEIRLGLQNGISTLIYSDKKYNEGQMRELRLSLEDNLDPVEVRSIATTKYTWEQMKEIRECYKERISLNDMRIIMNPEFSWEQMKTLRLICKNSMVTNNVFKNIANPKYDANKMMNFAKYFKYGYDLTVYCDPSYSIEEIEFFFECLEHGLQSEDIKALLSKALSHERRQRIYEAYLVMGDKYAFIGCNPEYDDEQVDEIYFMLKEKEKILYEFKNIWSNDNENRLLNLLKTNKKGGTSKLYQLNKTNNLELTDGDPIKWNITKIKQWKQKLSKIFKDVEKNYIIKPDRA
ncbi:hypothetical protein [Spiroplasma endosymbiont of Aspidapion aeneum]|uniref:hypothetical protein n=1 Tax=Spiroplasma endosymbiont of Aspidapion aeneum TaxID=3066276 RepID=UPI00313CB69D